MSNLLSQASLVMIPSGYKEDVVYSQIPTNGNGDLSFTRASNGTRVNSAGLVEVCPWNLVQNSENFSSGWTGVNNTITANSTTAPNGTTTADTFTLTPSGDSSIYQPVNGVSNNYTISVYAKYVSGDKYLYLFSPLNSERSKVWFDIQNGTVSNQLSGYTGTIESVGNGWYRCSMYNTTASVLDYIQFGISTTNSSRTLSNNSVSYFWGAQVNLGTAKPYFPTTDRLNVPRLTYQNGGGGCPSLLLEKQSTNLALWSEDFTQTAWVKTTGGSGAAPSVTANAGISPDGTQNADRVQFDCVGTTTSDRSILRQSISISNSTAYTFTFYVKAYSSGEIGKELNIRAENITGNPNITLTADWQRVSVSGTSSATSTLLIVETRGSVTANTTADILIWGAQLEASSYATSLIQTTSSSATRVADDIAAKSLSSVGITSNYTLFFQLGECNLSAAASWILQASSGANTPFQIYGTTAILYTSIGYIYPFSFLSVNPNNNKVAVSYDGTNIRVFWNGVKMGQWTATSEWANLTTLDLLYSISTQVQYKQVVLFNVGLNDADGISLTTI